MNNKDKYAPLLQKHSTDLLRNYHELHFNSKTKKMQSNPNGVTMHLFVFGSIMLIVDASMNLILDLKGEFCDDLFATYTITHIYKPQ